MERIVITGGSGFIGTNLISEMNTEFDILNLDIREPRDKSQMKYWKKVDILDFEHLRENVVEFKPSYIIHLAARCDLDGKSVEEYKENSVGVDNILRVAKEIKTLKKIIITSSMLVIAPGIFPENEKFYHPSTFYGESKVITEKITWDANLKCDWAIVRPTSIWGPWFGEPYYDFFKMIMKKRYIHIGGNTSIMTYGYVKNTVRQYITILKKDTSNIGRVFYLGDYTPINVEAWADLIAKNLNFHIWTCPMWIMKVAAKIGDCLMTFGVNFPITSFRLKNMTISNVFNMDNTEKVIAHLPYNIETGVEQTLEWMNKYGEK